MLNEFKNIYFLTEGVSNFGGAQLLVLRRAKYFSKIGYNVKIIIHRHRGEYFLKSKFDKYPILYIPEFELPISLVSKKRIKDILKTVELFLVETKNSILESNSLNTSVWGEYIASRFNMKHIVYLFNEEQVQKYKYYPYSKYFYFKYNRGELFGISEISISKIFNNKKFSCNNYVNVAFDVSEIAKTTIPKLKDEYLNKSSFKILTISRLEKKYIIKLIDACAICARKNTEIAIELIIAGDSVNNSIKYSIKDYFKKNYEEVRNLKMYMTGYIQEMGTDLFNNINVFIGMGTSVINSISQGCATIVIDPKSNLSSGIMGLDVNNFAYPENGNLYTIESRIELLLNDDRLHSKAKEKALSLYKENYTNEVAYQKYSYLLENSKTNTEYYYFCYNIINRIVDYIIYYLRKIAIRIKR